MIKRGPLAVEERLFNILDSQYSEFVIRVGQLCFVNNVNDFSQTEEMIGVYWLDCLFTGTVLGGEKKDCTGVHHSF